MSPFTTCRIPTSVPPAYPGPHGNSTGIYRLGLSAGPGSGSIPNARQNCPPAIFREPNGRCSERSFISGRQNHSRMNGRKAILPVLSRRKFMPGAPSRLRLVWLWTHASELGQNSLGHVLLENRKCFLPDARHRGAHQPGPAYRRQRISTPVKRPGGQLVGRTGRQPAWFAG